MIVKPIVESNKKDGDVVSVHFDITLIITKQNEMFAIDNSEQDYKEYVDDNTLIVKQLKLEVT